MERSSIVCLLVMLSLINLTFGDSNDKWSYDRDDSNYGPGAWAHNFAQCAKNKNSPINIATDDTVTRSAEPWTLTGWDSAADWTILDTNYTVKYSLESGNSISTAGGDLGEYDLLQFHFHWGAADTAGSEHTYNGKKFPLEVHFVHKKSSFATIDAAVESGDEDALAAVGFFFTIQTEDNPHLTALIEGVTQVKATDDYKVPGYTLQLSKFTTAATEGNFYRYYGGLTTPGCAEIVKWTVFETPIGISASQMAKFRSRQATEYGTEYYRDPLPLGSRVVTKYDVDCADATCGAPASLAPLSALIILSAISKYF